ncbi:MAG: hypothetical protein JSV65_15725 [Armatimonadota bacterium]|nr:MAG: hypothetical protein JSV65_15725 [Armatimonadota bacterium]
MKRYSICLVLLLIAAAMTPALAAGYRTSVGSGGDEIAVVVVSGTPYEMGYDYGRLMRDEVGASMGRYLEKAKADDPERCTDANLDAAWATMEPYVSARFLEELRGVAAGAGVPYALIRRAHSVPLVEDFACSGVAVWGAATANGRLYQIRNLDYTTDAGLQDYPVIVVYIPETGIPHANVAFAGFVGSMAGLNAEGIALTEKGASPSSDYPFDVNGLHFMVMFRSILQDAASLDDALAIVRSAKRIKKYYYMIGDGRRRAAAKIRAFAPELDIWPDNDPTDEVAPQVMPNLVYVTMDDRKAWDHFNAHYGQYNPELVIELSRLVGTDGGLTYVVYDPAGREMWVAYAEGNTPAHQREYVHFRLSDYLRRPPRG